MDLTKEEEWETPTPTTNDPWMAPPANQPRQEDVNEDVLDQLSAGGIPTQHLGQSTPCPSPAGDPLNGMSSPCQMGGAGEGVDATAPVDVDLGVARSHSFTPFPEFSM